MPLYSATTIRLSANKKGSTEQALVKPVNGLNQLESNREALFGLF